MRALTVIPLQAGSAAVVDMPEPEPGPGELLVDGIALGVCGTDREIMDGDYGWAPPGAERLVLGHESLGRVREAPDGSDFAPGDLVVGVVRRPDPEPCPACARGEFDFCRNGRYTERGIKELHGYGSERWTVEADYAVKLDPSLEPVGMLMEPTTILAKAWDQIERIGARAYFAPERVLVTGAGPIGLLAAMLGAQRGLEVHVLDRATEGPKPQLVADLGGHYHHTDVATVAGRPPAEHRHRGDRSRAGRGRGDRAQRRRRHRLPDRGLAGRAPADRRPRRAQPRHRARERRDLRDRQRQPAPLRAGGRGARSRPTAHGSSG